MLVTGQLVIYYTHLTVLKTPAGTKLVVWESVKNARLDTFMIIQKLKILLLIELVLCLAVCILYYKGYFGP